MFSLASQNLFHRPGSFLAKLALETKDDNAGKDNSKTFKQEELGAMGLDVGPFEQSWIEEDNSEESSAKPLVKIHLQDKQEELQANEAGNFAWHAMAIDNKYMSAMSMEAAWLVIQEPAQHFSGTHLNRLPINKAGVAVLVGDESWNWQDMILFYAERLEQLYTYKLA